MQPSACDDELKHGTLNFQPQCKNFFISLIKVFFLVDGVRVNIGDCFLGKHIKKKATLHFAV